MCLKLNLVLWIYLLNLKPFKKKNINLNLNIHVVNKNTLIKNKLKIKQLNPSVFINTFSKSKLKSFFFFINFFFINFIESFLKINILLNIKKNSNKIPIQQINKNYFYNKFFKKNLKISRQIISILYYSFLLKDTNIFLNFFKKILENSNIKSHKKILLGLKKIIKQIFKPIFHFLGLSGLFLNVKGKIGVSGNAKKRRYFFYFGKHSLTTRTLKYSSNNTNVWTFTGVLGLGFYLFF